MDGRDRGGAGKQQRDAEAAFGAPDIKSSKGRPVNERVHEFAGARNLEVRYADYVTPGASATHTPELSSAGTEMQHLASGSPFLLCFLPRTLVLNIHSHPPALRIPLWSS